MSTRAVGSRLWLLPSGLAGHRAQQEAQDDLCQFYESVTGINCSFSSGIVALLVTFEVVRHHLLLHPLPLFRTNNPLATKCVPDINVLSMVTFLGISGIMTIDGRLPRRLIRRTLHGNRKAMTLCEWGQFLHIQPPLKRHLESVHDPIPFHVWTVRIISTEEADNAQEALQRSSTIDYWTAGIHEDLWKKLCRVRPFSGLSHVLPTLWTRR
ncbi:hypothetical protein OF83DRAFT_655339 [Amylostereum chailletii]|nr:hypothetical protein OF83DRAFT_655339 [Amylostereum chailletii]